jgi:hypothetical protein
MTARWCMIFSTLTARPLGRRTRAGGDLRRDWRGGRQLACRRRLRQAGRDNNKNIPRAVPQRSNLPSFIQEKNARASSAQPNGPYVGRSVALLVQQQTSKKSHKASRKKKRLAAPAASTNWTISPICDWYRPNVGGKADDRWLARCVGLTPLPCARD